MPPLRDCRLPANATVVVTVRIFDGRTQRTASPTLITQHLKLITCAAKRRAERCAARKERETCTCISGRT